MTTTRSNTTQGQLDKARDDKVEEVSSLLHDILDRATEELGEWDGVEYAHLPIAMNSFWYIQKYAERALEKL